MELMEVIENRRAVRDYTSSPISRTVIERLIGAAILAPSALNSQPWAFAVLLDSERIEQYAERARIWMLENATPTPEAAPELLEEADYSMFYHAPALVIVMAQWSASQAIEDCCVAADNLILAARNEGIGSCWIGSSRPWLNLPSTKMEMALPEAYQVVAPIALGYPKAWPEFHVRRPAEIYWIGGTPVLRDRHLTV